MSICRNYLYRKIKVKTTMLSSDKGDPEMRIKGLRHLIFKPETLTKV